MHLFPIWATLKKYVANDIGFFCRQKSNSHNFAWQKGKKQLQDNLNPEALLITYPWVIWLIKRPFGKKYSRCSYEGREKLEEAVLNKS